MAGQGSLCQRIFLSRRSLPALGILCAFSLAQLTVCPSATRANEALDIVDLRLHCDWGSTNAKFWKVRLSIVDSQAPTTAISEIQNHSTSELTSGALELSSDAQNLTFQPRHAMLGGAVQLRVRAMRDAKLTIEVLSNDRRDFTAAASSEIKQIPLHEVIAGNRLESENGVNDASGKPSWSLQRITADELRLQTSGESPFYEPGAELHLSVRANALVRHASRPLNLQYSLYRVGDGETVSTHRQLIKVNSLGDSQPITINESVPDEPGVYEVRCEIVKDDENIWSRFRKPELPIVQIRHPIFVLSKKVQRHDLSAWRTVGEIRPSDSSWSMGQWLPKQTTRLIPDMTQIPGVGQIPGVSQIQGVSQSSSQDLATQEYAGDAVSLIKPNGTFQATLPVLTPGLPHRVTLRYPASRTTKLRIEVANADDRTHPVTSFVLESDANTDEPGGWKTYSFVHYPASDDQIWLTNLSESAPVAFESVSVQAGPNLLTSSTAPQATLRSTVLRLPNIDWVDSLSADVVSRSTLAGCEPATIGLYRLWVASNRLQDYALACGMNGVMIPANSGARTWFESKSLNRRHIGSTLESGRLAAFMKLMDLSQLRIYVDVHPTMLLSELERTLRSDASLTSELTRIHSGKGKQYNLLHPLVQENLNSFLRDVTRQCADHACFAGIVLHCETGSHLQPIAEAVDDPGALKLFAESNGASMSLPELRTWAQQQGKTKFENWLRDDTRRTYQRIGELLPHKPFYMVMQPTERTSALNETEEFDTQPFSQQWRSDRVNLVPVEPFRYGPAGVLSKQTLLEQQLSSISPPMRGVAVAAILGAESDEPLLVRDRVLADTSRIIDRLDPTVLIVDWQIAATSLQTGLSPLLRSFASMPDGGSGENTVRIHPTDPAAQTIRVTAGTIQGHPCVSIISLASWTTEVELNTSVAAEWVLAGNTDSEQHDTPELVNNGARVRIVLPPGQLAVLKSKTPSSNIQVKSWTSRVSGGPVALEGIKRKVTAIAERIGTLSDFQPSNTLANGGFEHSGGMGLVGWLHAQHPPGCVRIDDNEFVEGKRSVLLTTDESATTRTWLVSEMIEPPRSGRWAVSMFCRGELRNNDSAHRLRVSIEATRDGQPIRYSSDCEVPRNGQWGSREIVLEADGIEPETVDSLRLTIDSLSGGRVWIDDVQLHDRFPTAKERAVLQSQAFLAVQGLQRGNLTPSARLLNNYWARHLLTLGPSEKSKPVIEAVKRTEETPGVAERLRSWLPRPLRF
jgi:hypothetical protein